MKLSQARTNGTTLEQLITVGNRVEGPTRIQNGRSNGIAVSRDKPSEQLTSVGPPAREDQST